MKPSDILEKAATILEKPGAWTKGAYAKTATGREVDPNSRHAKCFCAIGAMCRAGRATEFGWGTEVYTAEQFLSQRVGDVLDWNDSRRSPSVVVREMREAAGLAREQGF